MAFIHTKPAQQHKAKKAIIEIAWPDCSTYFHTALPVKTQCDAVDVAGTHTHDRRGLEFGQDRIANKIT